MNPNVPQPPADANAHNAVDRPLLRYATELKTGDRQLQGRLDPAIAQSEVDQLWEGVRRGEGPAVGWPGDLSDPPDWWAGENGGPPGDEL